MNWDVFIGCLIGCIVGQIVFKIIFYSFWVFIHWLLDER